MTRPGGREERQDESHGNTSDFHVSGGNRRRRIVHQLLALDPTLTFPDTPAGRDARWWAELHAGLQKVRNVALVPTVGAQRAIACGEVIELLSGRTSGLSTATPGR
jgi:hypothetical protein